MPSDRRHHRVSPPNMAATVIGPIAAMLRDAGVGGASIGSGGGKELRVPQKQPKTARFPNVPRSCAHPVFGQLEPSQLKRLASYAHLPRVPMGHLHCR
jgi:hypothetical protein